MLGPHCRYAGVLFLKCQAGCQPAADWESASPAVVDREADDYCTGAAALACAL